MPNDRIYIEATVQMRDFDNSNYLEEVVVPVTPALQAALEAWNPYKEDTTVTIESVRVITYTQAKWMDKHSELCRAMDQDNAELLAEFEKLKAERAANNE